MPVISEVKKVMRSHSTILIFTESAFTYTMIVTNSNAFQYTAFKKKKKKSFVPLRRGGDAARVSNNIIIRRKEKTKKKIQ